MYKIKLTPYTKTFYYEWKLNPQSSRYNIVVDQTLHGSIDVDKLRQVTHDVVLKYLLVNSHVEQINEELCWVENDYIQDLEYHPHQLSTDELLQYVTTPFDLEKGPLYRFCLIQEVKNRYRFIAVCHHILVDGISADNIFSELIHRYNNSTNSPKYSLEAQCSLISSLNESLVKKVDFNLNDYRDFWQKKLADIEAVDLRFLKPFQQNKIDAKTINTIKELRFQFIADELKQLTIVSRRYTTTTFLFGQAIFALLLNRYTSQTNFGISYPIAIKEGADFIYAAQINSIIMPYHFEGNSSIPDLLKQINSFVKSLKSKSNINYRYCPVAEITAVSNKQLLNVVFAQTNLKDMQFKFDGITSVDINSEFNVDLFASLSFEQEIRDDVINYRVRYDSTAIDGDLLESFVEKYKKLFQTVLADLTAGIADKKIKEYNILAKEDYKRINCNYNKQQNFYPKHKTIHQLFEEQVLKTPNNIAVVYDNVKLTYEDLDCRSSRIASYLNYKYKIISGEPIGIYLPRNQYAIIAMLAILKSGGAYVILSQDYPDGRVKNIINNIQAKIILTNKTLAIKLKEILAINHENSVQHFKTNIDVNNNTSFVAIDNLGDKDYSSQKNTHKTIKATSTDLAYVIFTSGSTGLPKGVSISHRGVINTIWAVNNCYDVNDNDSVLALSSFTFDLSVYDIFGMLFVGGAIVLPTQEHLKDTAHWGGLISKHKISIWNTVPQLANLLIEDIKSSKSIKSLRLFLLSGDWIPVNLPVEIIKKVPDSEIVSLGGATECSIWSVWYDLTDKVNNLKFIPYGKAMPNQQVYVLDYTTNLCPFGAVGELYIGGDGVAVNYWGDEDKSLKSFINHEEFGKIYKTGDLVRWHPEGYLEFLGRNDTQVKNRGYRVELSEIEKVLNNYPEISQSIVIENRHINQLSNEYDLIGYYVAKNKLDEDNIFAYLRQWLPEYMVPVMLVFIEKIPLTINGKINRVALLEAIPKTRLIYVEPRNKLEKKLCKIFAEILGLEDNRISINEDFFRLGGNSILAIKLVNKIRQQLKLKVDIALIFQCRNVVTLAKQICSNRSNQTTSDILIQKYSKLNISDYKLSFAQERLYFLSQEEKGNKSYNVPLIFKLNQTCDMKILTQSIKDVLERHEVLRTIVKADANGELYQAVLLTEIAIGLKLVKSEAKLQEYIKADTAYLFNLNKEIPIKIHYYKYNGEYYLSLVIHHIAFDGWSGDVLIKDLLAFYAYNQKISNGNQDAVAIPALAIQYKDFALWQRSYLTKKKLKCELDYWKNRLTDIESLNLPLDKPRPKIFDYQGAICQFQLNLDLSRALRNTAKELNVSLYSLLLSGFYLLLRVYSNQDNIVIGAPVSNRHYLQTRDLVGFFVNTLVLTQKIDSNNTIVNYIKRVFANVLDAQLHQDLPFEKLVEVMDVDKDVRKHPIFQVMFIVQNFGRDYKQLFNFYSFKGMNNTAKFDLTMLIDDANEQLVVEVEYATSLFVAGTINSYIETYTIILEQLANIFDKDNVEKQIKDIYYLSDASYKKWIIDYNRTEKNYPKNKTIHQLFEEQVKKTPDNIALVYENIKLSYQELNAKSNQLAYYIREKYHILPDDLVALCLDRNERMLIAILAVLKAGGAYVPIDPEYPNERIEYILTDTSAELILTNAKYKERLEKIVGGKREILATDTNDITYQLNLQKKENLITATTGSNLAYVIYTSGTSGKPKGVMVQHKALYGFCYDNNLLKINESSCILANSNYAFDGSIFDFFYSLCNCAKVVLINIEDLLDKDRLRSIICKYMINTAFFTTSLFEYYMRLGKNNPLLLLKNILFGGEVAGKLDALLPYVDDITIINGYGPTENIFFATFAKLTGSNWFLAPIGKRLNDKNIYVVNSNLMPVPIGAIGELCIGGYGVAKGYVNNKELTETKFIANPFQTDNDREKITNSKLYKTGDLVRMLPNYDLIFIGRNDSQIKIRGHRVELSEIEAVLNSYPGIKQSAVVAFDHKNIREHKYLVGYYVKKIATTIKDKQNLVNNWKRLYNSIYTKLSRNNYKENIIGWNSSYTESALSRSEMLEWRDEALKKIRDLKPSTILEIGSGSGLLLFNLIDSCDYYYATDFSIQAIKYLKEVINKFNYQDKVATIRCDANKLPFKKLQNKYDTVIMNSIVQYFPTLKYFEKVVIKLINNMSTGKIFIGDIRDYRLLDCFYYSIFKFKHAKVDFTQISHLKTREKELLISPAYFIHLHKIIPAISSVELLPKLGHSPNEMNNFRYDVILHINRVEQKEQLSFINTANSNKIFDIDDYLLDYNKEYIQIKYPRKMIFNDYIEYKEIFHNKNELNFVNADRLLEIDELINLLKTKDYDVNVYLDEIDPLYLNVIGNKTVVDTNKKSWSCYSNVKIYQVDMANNPVHNIELSEDGRVANKIREFLAAKLPGYMVPKYLLLMDKLPLNHNGKLDHRALPTPEYMSSNDYKPPRNQIEKKLCELVAQVLGMKFGEIGIEDDFFKIGGNSILAVNLLTKIESIFNRRLKIVDIFISKNVRQMAHLILGPKGRFKLISHLNHASKKINLFMIHPGFAGPEVYISLAGRLSEYYSCYGVDNYNLHHKIKINNIRELAILYLSAIDKTRHSTKQTDQPYLLLGWSLGGQIILEIVGILEKAGHKNIKIILLDSIFPDNKIISYLSKLKMNFKLAKEFFRQQGLFDTYINKIIANFSCEVLLSQQGTKIKFNYTKILLFKAIQKDRRNWLHNHELNNYTIRLPYNNIDQIADLSKISLIKLPGANHFNILEQEDLILNNILFWCNS